MLTSFYRFQCQKLSVGREASGRNRNLNLGSRTREHTIERQQEEIRDAWSEHFRYDNWLRAFNDAGLDPGP